MTKFNKLKFISKESELEKEKLTIPLDSNDFIIGFLSQRKFELGTMYICDKHVVFVVEEKYRDFAANYENSVKNFVYDDEKMEKEVSRYLPKIINVKDTKNKERLIVIEKTPDLLLLDDVLKYFGNKIPERHVAWILSSLYNLCCYTDHIDMSNNGILLNSYFISPQFHSGALLGGWWYAVQQNTKMIGVPPTVYSVLPSEVLHAKTGNIMTDLKSVQLIGQQLFGDHDLYKNAAPKSMVDFLENVVSKKAVPEYKAWTATLEICFGKKKFIEMPIDREKFYNINKVR